MRSYETARRLFTFLEFCSWAMLLGGGVLFLIGLNLMSDIRNEVFGMGAIAIGFMMAFWGIVGAAGSQAARASVDSAEYGQQSLKVAREQLEISRHALRAQLGVDSSTYASLASKTLDFPPKASETRTDAAYAAPPEAAEHDQVEAASNTAINDKGTEIAPALPDASNSAPSIEALLKVVPEPVPEEQVTTHEYRGQPIEERGGQFRWHNIPFESLRDVKAHLDNVARFGPLPPVEGKQNDT